MNLGASDPTFHLDHDLGGFFRQVVDDTLQHHPQKPDPLVHAYLLGLLEDAGHTPEPIARGVGRPLSTQLVEALQAPAVARFDRLRQVGDSVLLMGGLYRGYLVRSGVDDDYVVAVGRKAYAAAASLMDVPRAALGETTTRAPDVLSELAHGFHGLMVLLRDVALTIVAQAARSSADLARLCELWIGERSAHLGRLLRARGVMLEVTPVEPTLVLTN
jgi:hypothetical protein